MAIVINDKSDCVICRKILKSSDRIYLFSPFVINEIDPLYFLSDAGVHRNCLANHELGKKAIKRHEELLEVSALHEACCFICNNKFIDFDDILAFGFLPSDKYYDVLDYRICHESCLKDWADLERIYAKLVALQDQGVWDGRGPKCILDILKKALISK